MVAETFSLTDDNVLCYKNNREINKQQFIYTNCIYNISKLFSIKHLVFVCALLFGNVFVWQWCIKVMQNECIHPITRNTCSSSICKCSTVYENHFVCLGWSLNTREFHFICAKCKSPYEMSMVCLSVRLT